MMKPITVSREILESTPTLTEEERQAILKKPYMGFKIDRNRKIRHSSLQFMVNGEETEQETFRVMVSAIAEESNFSDSPMQPGHYLISINGYHPIEHLNKTFAWASAHDSKHAFVSMTGFIKDGETVSVEFGVPRRQRQNTLNGVEEVETLEHHRVQVKIQYLYEVTNPVQAVKIERHRFQTLPARIKQKLFNQDQAVEKVFKALKVNMAGLKDDRKPVGSYLFVGPTGTGKTELAKLLAKETSAKLVRVDMSEYSQEHQVSRFIGSPAGYVGYNDKTILETQIGEDGKKVVLLLDEMEKAHVEIQKLFLAAMDNGTITLSNHKVINLTNTLILMTSNLGIVTKESLGLERTERKLSVDMNKIRVHFLPEFMGRLNGVVTFNPLTESHAEIILNKFVTEFNQEKLKAKKTELRLTEAAKRHLISIGFNTNYGARPLKQVLQDNVYEKLADLFLFDEMGVNAAYIEVDYKEGQGICLDPKTPKKPPLPTLMDAEEATESV